MMFNAINTLIDLLVHKLSTKMMFLSSLDPISDPNTSPELYTTSISTQLLTTKSTPFLINTSDNKIVKLL